LLSGLNFTPARRAFDRPIAIFLVRANGTARVTITDSRVNLGSDTYSLFTDGGTALVIHAEGDDMKTDPSGNSGDRIACGVITT